MNSLQGLSSWGSNLIGQASEQLKEVSDQLAPSAAAAAAHIRSGVKEVRRSVKENFGTAGGGVASSFVGQSHVLKGARGSPPRDVTEVAHIAEGAFGAVMKVTCSRTGERFALKKISCAEGVQVASSFEAAEREAKILSELPPHENIIRCFGFSIDAPQRSGGSGTVKLLLELCNGHLLDFQDSKGGKLSPKEMMDPFVQVTEAVRHLHAQRPPIQHRDLKVENVLQGSDGNWKLCDFGSCSTACVPGHELPRGELQRLQEEIDKTVTMLYRPPEMADVQLNYRKGYAITEQVDIWMLGCILYTLAFYRHPFQDNATPMAIWNAKYFIPSEHPMARSAKLCALIHWLLAADPKDRPQAPRVLEACKSIGKSEYDEFVGQMPASVRDRILQHDRIYGARSTKEPPKEWDLKNLQSAAAAARSQVAASHSNGQPNGKVRETQGFDVRFALSPDTNGSGGYSQSSQGGRRQAAAKPPSLQEDLLSLDAGSHQQGLHQAASSPALDDLIALGPATPSRAKSAPAVATPEGGAGQNLLAFASFADFGSMPQQAQPAPAALNGGFPAPAAPMAAAPNFADFGSAPTFDALAPTAAAAPAQPSSGPSANLLDLL
ncbi:unnamed protein product [Symbiodinium natans]|uniref:non-specific serine/threonine protein kinase n=1 Tax=Symbiodinium natans TaxID=878477 RepID=A0A812GAN6_9DINO|nr:unnamed protein product [Symbiodinium natans]